METETQYFCFVLGAGICIFFSEVVAICTVFMLTCGCFVVGGTNPKAKTTWYPLCVCNRINSIFAPQAYLSCLRQGGTKGNSIANVGCKCDRTDPSGHECTYLQPGVKYHAHVHPHPR